MNRRGFIKGFLAACVAPAVFLPVAQDRYRWVADQKRLEMAVINSEWQEAPYELDFMLEPKRYFGEWQFIGDQSLALVSIEPFERLIIHHREATA